MEDNLHSSDKVFQEEYMSIMRAFCLNALIPMFGFGDKKLDRDIVGRTLSDLESKIASKDFKELPFKIKDAYKTLEKFVKTMKSTEDKELLECNDVMKSLSCFFAICYTSGSLTSLLGPLPENRNACRGIQYNLYGTLNKARKKKSLPLLDATAEVLDVCNRCPYK